MCVRVCVCVCVRLCVIVFVQINFSIFLAFASKQLSDILLNLMYNSGQGQECPMAVPKLWLGILTTHWMICVGT